jgi:hypothetical protein
MMHWQAGLPPTDATRPREAASMAWLNQGSRGVVGLNPDSRRRPMTVRFPEWASWMSARQS